MAKIVERHNGTEVVYSGLPLPKLAKETRNAQRAAMRDVVLMIRRRFGPSHFTFAAYSLYAGVDPRVYAKRKTRNKPPLVRSGRLRREFLSATMRVNSTGVGTRLKARGRFMGPLNGYVNAITNAQGASDGKPPGPKIALELVVINNRQAKESAGWFAKLVEEHLTAAAGGL